VIDTVDVILSDQPEELAIQGARGGFIVPKGLFDDQAAPATLTAE
jgi:hypothetical protein